MIMTQDWAWRVVFTDGSQFYVRGFQASSNNGGGIDFKAGNSQITTVAFHNLKYAVFECKMDWPDGVYIMRLPDTDAAPPKPEG